MLQDEIKEIRDVLREVKYPGTSKNIVELDMVQHVRIEGNKVMFRLVFQRSDDPFVGAITKKCRSLLEDYEEVEIEPVFVHDLERPLSLEKVRNVIAVSSGKGGVGKSTVASNLAVALALQGYKVGLVDADIFGPSVPKMFGCEEAHPYIEKIEEQDMIVPVEKYGVKILSIGFFIDPPSDNTPPPCPRSRSTPTVRPWEIPGRAATAWCCSRAPTARSSRRGSA